MSLPIAARAPWSAAALHWTQAGVRWLTVAAKHVAWIDPGGGLVTQAPAPLRVHDVVGAGGLVEPAEIVPRTPGAEVFVVGRMLPSAAAEPSRRGRLRLVRGGVVLVDAEQVVPPPLAGAPFVPPALAPLARRFPVRARWLEGRDPTSLETQEPELPPGLDLRYFVAAAPALVVDALRPGDRLLLEGLIAGRPSVSITLPDGAPRVRLVEGGKVVDDVAPSLAVVAIDLERAVLTRIFRCVARVDRRRVDEIVVDASDRSAGAGPTTALVDPGALAAMRVTPFTQPQAPSAPSSAGAATALVDADLLAELRAAYRDATPFQDPAEPAAAPAAVVRPASLDDTPFRRASGALPRSVAVTAPLPPSSTSIGGTYAALPVAPPAAPTRLLPPPGPPADPEPASPPTHGAAPITRRFGLVAAEPGPAPWMAPDASSGGVTGAVDPAELRALREAHATPFRELKPTEKRAALEPSPAVSSSSQSSSSSSHPNVGDTGAVPASELVALRAAAMPVVPFRRASTEPLAPFSTSWAEAFLCALNALEGVGPR